MVYHHKYRNRVITAFCIFGLILSLVYGLAIFTSMAFVADTVFRNRLKNEINNFLEQQESDPHAPLALTSHIKGYLGRQEMPVRYREMTEGLTEGFYETDGPGAIKGPRNLHLAIQKLPGQDELLYMIYDVGNLKVHKEPETLVVLVVTSLFVTAIGAVIGVLIAGRVTAPLTRLTDILAQSLPEKLPVDLSAQFGDDEIGFLARTLDKRIQRIQNFVQREKAFTRDASHELRTPVTVVRNAAELISQLPAYRESSLQRPMRRIERAAAGMALTIDTFLWLAREDGTSGEAPACDVSSMMAREALVEHEYVFRGKQIRTEFLEEGSPLIHAPEAVFRIVINNLVRNAFTHTQQGLIRIVVSKTAVEVFNSGGFFAAANTDKKGTGFGFGLDIVKRLCDRYNWHLQIAGDPDGTIVTLKFS